MAGAPDHARRWPYGLVANCPPISRASRSAGADAIAYRSPPMGTPGFTAQLADQEDPEIGQELIRVRFDDGRVCELRLHDYDRLYALPGVYEQIVHDRLGCRSPGVIADMLAAAVDALGWERGQVRAFDVAAGNGVSGEALAAVGLAPVLATDIVPSARQAALRDRPGRYDDYLTLDLLALSAQQRAAVAGACANVLSCVAPVGDRPAQLPADALLAAARLLTADALIAHMHDPAVDPVTAEWWIARLGPDTRAELMQRRRYLHRRTVNGRPVEMIGAVWHVRRASPDDESAQAE